MPLHVALALQRFTPFGGLERNALALAEACVERGHAVTMLVRSWEGVRPRGIEVVELPVGAATNVGRDRAFAEALAGVLERCRFDVVVGFGRVPGVDVFYAADPCYAATRGRGARAWLPQRAARLAWERALAAADATAEILVLSAREEQRFRAHYRTPPTRLHVLPPGLRAEFLAAGPARAPEVRAELGIPADTLVVLAVGSDFGRKGLDRTLRAVARLPEPVRARAFVVAVGAGRPARCERLAQSLGLGAGSEARVRFVGGRTDVLAFHRTANVLVHPAREENTGGVLLEAMSQGVPVIASGACGFAEIVSAAGAGVALAEPFVQVELDHALATLLRDEGRRIELGERGRAAAEQWPMAARTARMLAVLEAVADRRRAAGTVPAPAAR